MAWLFGDFALDEDRRLLLRAGVPLRLEPKAYELLSLLIARQPRALSKDQIHHVLWPGTFVSESALAGLIADLRSALGDDARRPRFIRTVHGFGYAFCGDATLPAGPGAAVLRTLVLCGSGSAAPRAFERPFAAVMAVLDECASAAVHVVECSAGSRPPVLLQQLASLARPGQVLLSQTAFNLARDAADPRGDGLIWLAHGPYLFDGIPEPVDVFEVGRPGTSVLKPPPDTANARRVLRPGDEATLGWRPASGLRVPGRDDWTLLDKLGEGGFGEAWLAGHASGERAVFKFCFDAARLRGLKREATLFRLLKEELGERDDIARVRDWNFDEPPYFLESEYTEGGSLVDWGRAAGGIATIALSTRVLLVAQVAEALAAAHSVGVIHKDVKPQNILIAEDQEGRPKARLADFGVGLVRDRSVLIGRDFTVTGFTDATNEESRRVSGTRLYAAPEVLEGKTPTTLADIYALGVVLYQMVVGDLDRALAPGWERDVADDLLKEDIGICVEGRPERRLANAQYLADRLRRLDARRHEQEAPRRKRRRQRVLTAIAALAVVALGATLFSVGAKVAERPVPQFHRITFQPDAVGKGRFTPDGRRVAYIRWGIRPDEVFTVRLDSVEPRSLGLNAHVAAATASELAVILPNNTLARMPLDGGVPREIVEQVAEADWAPDGSFAIMRQRYPIRIEYPPGHVLYESPSFSFGQNLRVSPQGDRVAFIQHQLADNVEGFAPNSGNLIVVDRDGRKLVSSEWSSIGGLAWTPDGQEVWFSATKTGFASSLYAIRRDGQERLVGQMGETVYLHDISRDGRVLIAEGRIMSECRGRVPGDSEERSYSWLDGTTGARFSRDGLLFIFNEAIGAGSPARRAYLRRIGQPSPVWLGEGTAFDISPDGKWVVCLTHRHPVQLRLVPTGAGDARPLPRGPMTAFRDVFFAPDGKRLVGLGDVNGRPEQQELFVQALPDGEPRPIPGVVQSMTAISPDGRFVTARATLTDLFRLYPLDGGEPRPIAGITDTDIPARFSTDGTALFVTEIQKDLPSQRRIARLDLTTGRRRPWLDLRSPDARSICSAAVSVTPDGKSYLYCFVRFFSELYIIDGLR
jgi:serine/threonine protein kinase/DNA-binding winged helix-turn-helix (wHTH) protein